MVAQVCAAVIFVAMFILIIMDKIERQWITLSCGALTIVVVFGICQRSLANIWQVLNLSAFARPGFWYQSGTHAESSAGINWDTILFIVGMMIMVEGMAKSGFFRWLCLLLAKLVKYRVLWLLVEFMVMSAVLGMFIDSITVILFLAAVTIELGRLLKFNPIPLILAEIFCANLGGSATMCGDPPNIIIGTSLGYSFTDFLTNTGFIAMLALVLVVIYYVLIFRKVLVSGEVSKEELQKITPSSAITSRRGFYISTVIFLLTVVLLVTHAQTGLTVALIGVISASLTLLAAGKKYLTILKGVDYKTALFFVGLFIVVGGMELTGVLELIAGVIEAVSVGNLRLMVAIIIWVSAIASAFVDNIPFAATMIPVIKSLAAVSGADLSTLAWGLAIGTDIGGSATPIGASANVVGISVAQREGYTVGWGRYCKTAIPPTILVLVIATLIIWMRYC